MSARSFVISLSDIARCPKASLSARHYLETGECACSLDRRIEALDQGDPGSAELRALKALRKTIVR